MARRIILRPMGWEENADLRRVSWCGAFLDKVVKEYVLEPGEVVIYTNSAQTRIRFVRIGIGGVPEVVCPKADTNGHGLSIYLQISLALASLCPPEFKADTFAEEVESMHKRRLRRRSN
jgi:hypothetical protein